MDRTGVSNKRGTCQISFMYLGERYRISLRGLKYDRASDRREATRTLAVVQREIQLGIFYFPAHFPNHQSAKRFKKGHQIEIRDALREWLLSRREQIEPTTFRGYEKVIVHHLIPRFGDLRMSQLQTSDVEDWIEEADGCGKTKNNILIPLRAIFRKAKRDDLIERDPLERIPNIAHRPKQPDPLSSVEISAVLEAAEGQIRNIIEFAIWTGLRTSELIAVRWQDVDLDNAKLHVRMTRTFAGEKSRGKTAAAMRAVDLYPPAVDALQRQRAFTADEKFVFINPRNGKPWLHDGPYRKTAWTPVLLKAGVRYRPAYQTRHTFASQLLSAGAEPMYVAEQMGHRDWGMIRKVYGRWLPEFSQNQRDKIATLWAPMRHQNNASL